MIFEHLRSRLMRSGANDREGADCVGDIRNPLLSTFLVLPSGPPIWTREAWCFSTHAFHAAMPRTSLALRSGSESAFQAVHFGLFLLPRNTARYVSFVLIGFSWLVLAGRTVQRLACISVNPAAAF